MAKYTWIETRLKKTSLRRLVKTQDGYSHQPQWQQVKYIKGDDNVSKTQWQGSQQERG